MAVKAPWERHAIRDYCESEKCPKTLRNRKCESCKARNLWSSLKAALKRLWELAPHEISLWIAVTASSDNSFKRNQSKRNPTENFFSLLQQQSNARRHEEEKKHLWTFFFDEQTVLKLMKKKVLERWASWVEKKANSPSVSSWPISETFRLCFRESLKHPHRRLLQTCVWSLKAAHPRLESLKVIAQSRSYK